jgi:hypothetical protein
MSVSSITPIGSAHYDIHNGPLNDNFARVLLWPGDIEGLSMIPGVNSIAVNKYSNVNIKLCKPILRNIFLKDDHFTQLYVSSKINYTYICMYVFSIPSNKPQLCFQGNHCRPIYAVFLSTLCYMYRSDDGLKIGQPWKHNFLRMTESQINTSINLNTRWMSHLQIIKLYLTIP